MYREDKGKFRAWHFRKILVQLGILIPPQLGHRTFIIDLEDSLERKRVQKEIKNVEKQIQNSKTK